MQKYLFGKQPTIHDVIIHQQQSVEQALAQLRSDEILGRAEELVTELTERFRLSVPTLDQTGIVQLPSREIDIDVSGAQNRAPAFFDEDPYVKGTAVRIGIPFMGEKALFEYPVSALNNIVPGEIEGDMVVLTSFAEHPDTATVKRELDANLVQLETMLQMVRGPADEWNRRLTELIRRGLDKRKGKIERDLNLNIGYPKASPASSAPDFTSPTDRGRPEISHDLFLSHASEDKDRIARPLHDALTAAGVSVWFDEAVLQLGDSLRQKIDEGLARCRFGIVVLSPSFLKKRWPQQELNGLVARETTSGEKAIIPIWHNLDAAVLAQHSPILADRVAGRSDEGVSILVEKILRVLNNGKTEATPSLHLPIGVQAVRRPDQRFFDQRARDLAETKVVKQVLAKPRWRVWICPIDFMEARFRDLDHCAEFVSQNVIKYASGDDYPHANSIIQNPAGQSITCEFEVAPMRHIECWALFRSGQCVHNLALPDIVALGNNVHYLHILQIVSQVFEFAARMACEGVLSPSALVSIELLGVAGRGLVVPPDVNGRYWAQQKDIIVEKFVGPDVLAKTKRDLALDVVLEIYQKFRWTDASRARLATEQKHHLPA